MARQARAHGGRGDHTLASRRTRLPVLGTAVRGTTRLRGGRSGGVRHARHSSAQIPADERADPALARPMTALAHACLFADRAHPIDGTTPTVNVGTKLGGGIAPFMHPETEAATLEIGVIERLTMTDVHEAVRQVIRHAGPGGPRARRTCPEPARQGAAQPRRPGSALARRGVGRLAVRTRGRARARRD